MKKILLFALLACVAAGADIEWKQTEVELRVHPVQVSTEAVFEFTNTGDEPVSFPNVVLTCGCLSSKPLRPSYASGETGQLCITLNLLNRVGHQRKHVLVETSDGERTDLSISVDIPQAYVVEPKLLNWKKGDDAEQKTVRLTNPNTIPIRLLSIDSSHELLPAELKTIKEGFEYEVVVQRKPGAANARSVIRISTEPPPGLTEAKTTTLYVFAQ